MLHDNNFPMEIQQRVNRQVTAAAFKGTKWAPIIPLCESKTAFGFCSTTDVSMLMKMLKKMPAFILIGLIYENRLLHRDDVDNLVKLSNNIVNLHSQLSTTLNLPIMNLTQNLMIGQVTLTNSLSSYTKSQESSSSSSDSDSDSSSDSDSDTESKKKI